MTTFIYIDHETGVVGNLDNVSVFDGVDVPQDLDQEADSTIKKWVESNKDIAMVIYPMYKSEEQ